jgi:alpha-methylacyl-CoA racemase
VRAPIEQDRARGPLAGVRVLELGGIGPGPFASMTLAQHGADVVRIDRATDPWSFPGTSAQNLLHRGKRSITLNLKQPEDRATAHELAAAADVIVEGFRPGVTEQWQLGPRDCLNRNPKLVYGRMTGWGQDGPRSKEAGHDLNYIAVTGALHAIGQAGGPPQIPLNLLGDFAGGGAYLVIGILAALHEVSRTGRGQVVDAAIVDGVSHLMTSVYARAASGSWTERRGENLFDGGAPFYAVYPTADGRHMAVGALETPFYAAFLKGLGLADDPVHQHDRAGWPALRQRIAAAFATGTQAEWEAVFAGTDACVSPVRSLSEAAKDPHLAARGTTAVVADVLQPAVAPRLSHHPATPVRTPPSPGEHTAEVLEEWRRPSDK